MKASSWILAAIWIIAVADVGAQRGATGPIADLNGRARDLTDTAPEQSLAAAAKAQALAHEGHDLRGEAEAYNYIAYAHRSQSLLDLARRDAKESVRLYVAAGDRWGEAQGYNALGLTIREKDADKEGLSYTFNNLGNMYRNMGEYAKALEYHERGLKLKIELGNKSSEAYSHHNMGLV